MRRWSCASGKSVRGANLVLHGQSASAGLLWPAWPVADRHVTRFLWLCIRRGSRRSVCLFVRMSSRLAMLLIRMRPPPPTCTCSNVTSLDLSRISPRVLFSPSVMPSLTL